MRVFMLLQLVWQVEFVDQIDSSASGVQNNQLEHAYSPRCGRVLCFEVPGVSHRSPVSGSHGAVRFLLVRFIDQSIREALERD